MQNLCLTSFFIFFKQFCSDISPMISWYIHKVTLGWNASSQKYKARIVFFSMTVWLVQLAFYIDGLVQNSSNSTANALELPQSCTKPLICPSKHAHDSIELCLLCKCYQHLCHVFSHILQGCFNGTEAWTLCIIPGLDAVWKHNGNTSNSVAIHIVDKTNLEKIYIKSNKQFDSSL